MGGAPLDGVRLLLSWLYPADILSSLTVEQVHQAVANKSAALHERVKLKMKLVQQLETWAADQQGSKRPRTEGPGTGAGKSKPC